MHEVLLYAPCYLSNFCINSCSYCAFRWGNPIERRQLDLSEVAAELGFLFDQGLRRVILVASEFPKKVTVEYLAAATRIATALGMDVDLSVAPLSVGGYRVLREAGARGVTCYQETYQHGAYADLHPRGPKGKYGYRLATAARAIEAGMDRIGLGILLGLANPIVDLAALVEHAEALLRAHPGMRLTVNLPRLRPAAGAMPPVHPVTDREVVSLYRVLRDALPAATLVASTREPPALREALLAAGARQISAGSCTIPGGYTHPAQATPQFALADERPVHEVQRWLVGLGYAPRFE